MHHDENMDLIQGHDCIAIQYSETEKQKHLNGI